LTNLIGTHKEFEIDVLLRGNYWLGLAKTTRLACWVMLPDRPDAAAELCNVATAFYREAWYLLVNVKDTRAGLATSIESLCLDELVGAKYDVRAALELIATMANLIEEPLSEIRSQIATLAIDLRRGKHKSEQIERALALAQVAADYEFSTAAYFATCLVLLITQAAGLEEKAVQEATLAVDAAHYVAFHTAEHSDTLGPGRHPETADELLLII
jgi:hypothetical protein